MHKIRTSAVILLCLIMAMFFSVSYAAAPLTLTEAECQELIAKANENLRALKSYRMNVENGAVIPIRDDTVKIMVNSELDVQSNPLLLKRTTIITLGNSSGVNKKESVSYIGQSGNEFIVYSGMGDQWLKQSLPNYDPLTEYDSYFKSVSSITPIAETADSIVVKVIAGAQTFKWHLSLIRAFTGLPQQVLTEDWVKELNDVPFTLTISKKEAVVSGIDIDLSAFAANFGDGLAGLSQVPDTEKEEIKEVFNNIKMFTRVSFSQFNKIPKIVIDQQARNAKDLTPSGTP